MNIDKFKSLCTNIIENNYGEIWGYFGKFFVLTTNGYNGITIYYPYPSKEGCTHTIYTLPYEYEKAYNKLNEVILILKLQHYNEKIERIKDDF